MFDTYYGHVNNITRPEVRKVRSVDFEERSVLFDTDIRYPFDDVTLLESSRLTAHSSYRGEGLAQQSILNGDRLGIEARLYTVTFQGGEFLLTGGGLGSDGQDLYQAFGQAEIKGFSIEIIGNTYLQPPQEAQLDTYLTSAFARLSETDKQRFLETNN